MNEIIDAMFSSANFVISSQNEINHLDHFKKMGAEKPLR